MKPKLVVLRVAFGWLKKSDAVTRCMHVSNFANEVHLDGIYGQLCSLNGGYMMDIYLLL